MTRGPERDVEARSGFLWNLHASSYFTHSLTHSPRAAGGTASTFPFPFRQASCLLAGWSSNPARTSLPQGLHLHRPRYLEERLFPQTFP